jgi:hypothetical protein
MDSKLENHATLRLLLCLKVMQRADRPIEFGGSGLLVKRSGLLIEYFVHINGQEGDASFSSIPSMSLA